jgi:hypothetical protein
MRPTHGIDWMRGPIYGAVRHWTGSPGNPQVLSGWLVGGTGPARAGPMGSLMALFLWNLPGLVVLTICGPFDFCRFYRSHLTPPAIFFGGRLDKLGVILALITSTTVTILINNDRRIETNVRQWVFPLQMFGLRWHGDFKRPKPLVHPIGWVDASCSCGH